MKKPRYTDSQIMTILKQAEAGTPVPQLCREHGMSSASVRRHIKWHGFRPGLRETLLISLVDIKRRLCGIASVDVRLSAS